MNLVNYYLSEYYQRTISHCDFLLIIVLLMVITCVNKRSNDEIKREEREKYRNSLRRSKTKGFHLCLCFGTFFSGTQQHHGVRRHRKKRFSAKCLSQYRALVLFIGQISSEAEVFWMQVFLRVKKEIQTHKNSYSMEDKKISKRKQAKK